jgi:hypothetical protein
MPVRELITGNNEQDDELDVSPEEVERQISELESKLKGMLHTDIPRDVRLIKAAVGEEDLYRFLKGTYWSYLRGTIEAIISLVELLKISQSYNASLGTWCDDISDHVDDLEEDIEDLQGAGGTVLGRGDSEILMQLVAGSRLLVTECLTKTIDEQGKESLSRLLLLCEQGMRILKEATITEMDELEEDAPFELNGDEEPS